MKAFKAPQKKLQSSFPQVAFTKAKIGGLTIKRSLGNRPTMIIKDRGTIATSSSLNHSNIY